MLRNVRLKTAPSVEPVTLAAAKTFMRVTVSDTDNDADITAMIKVARQYAENVLNRALITQTWTLYMDAFPSCIKVPLPRLQSVTHIKYLDDSGALQTLDSSLYYVDLYAEPGRVVPAYGQSWPTTYPMPSAVQMEYVAGYGDAAANVPDDIINAIKVLVNHLYSHRSVVITGTIVNTIPMTFENLLWPHRVLEF